MKGAELSPRTDTGLLYAFDRDQGCSGILVGVDEAGRGPLAGPVVAAAVTLDPDFIIDGIDDSKKVPEKKREVLYEEIAHRARAWAWAAASPEEIEKHNILRATLLAMQRALDALGCAWDLALIDGNRMLDTLPSARQRCVVAGDAHSASIAAASIIAKVQRDRMMREYNAQYPVYGFSVHKGYGTAAHIDRIRKFGLCAIHRKSFCEHLIAQTSLAI